MGNKVLVNLNHGCPRLFIIFQAGFAANACNLGVVGTGGNKAVQRVFADAGISINHEKVFVQLRVNADDVVDLVKHFQFEG